MLGITVTAEGVETAAQASNLAQPGCKIGQGYFFSKPLDEEAATRMLLADRAAEPIRAQGA
jgi:EAL domain-containing protein (putative c-di-GMP-specific phosphodiesterase class I)